MNYFLFIFQEMGTSLVIKLLIILISSDAIFGLLTAIKDRKINSTIGINGLIRKFTMLLVVVVLYFIDVLVNVNFISIVPPKVIEALNFPEVGLCELFGIILILFETLSIFKHLAKLEIPLPKTLKNSLEKMLDNMTYENKNNSNLKQ